MISKNAQLSIMRIPLSNLQVVEADMPWLCFPEKFNNYLKLLQEHPDQDVDPLIVQPNPAYPGMFRIVNGKHRYCAGILAGRKDTLCIVEEVGKDG